MSELETTRKGKGNRKREPQDKPIVWDFEKMLDNLTTNEFSQLTISEKTIISKQLALAGMFRAFFIKLAPNIMRALDFVDLDEVARSNPEKFFRILRDLSTILVSTSEMERKISGLSNSEYVVNVRADSFAINNLDYSKLSDAELEKLLASKTETDLTNDILDEFK